MTDTTATDATSTDSSVATETADGATTTTTVVTPEANTDATAENTEGQTEGNEPKDDADGEKQETEGAPENYADFNVPEGQTLDTATTDSFKEVAKELNLNQADAQRVVDLGVQMSQRWAEAQATAFAEEQAGWRRDAEADAEIGGDALPQNLALAKKALDTFGNERLTELVEGFKLGDHPGFLKLMVQVGKAISEDTLVTPAGSAPKADRSLAERIYRKTS